MNVSCFVQNRFRMKREMQYLFMLKGVSQRALRRALRCCSRVEYYSYCFPLGVTREVMERRSEKQAVRGECIRGGGGERRCGTMTRAAR